MNGAPACGRNEIASNARWRNARACRPALNSHAVERSGARVLHRRFDGATIAVPNWETALPLPNTRDTRLPGG